MKKIIALGCILLLSSCTLPWSDSDGIPDEHTFDNDYKRHIAAVFENVDEYQTQLYSVLEAITPSGYDNSKIRTLFSMSETWTGELTIQADAVRQDAGYKFGIEFLISGFLESIDGEYMKLDELKGGVIKDIATYYFRIDSAALSWSGAEFSDSGIEKSWDEAFSKLRPHFGKWIHLDMLTLAATDLDDDASLFFQWYMAFISDLASGGNTLQKILTEKSILRSTESLGKQGDYYAYKVESDAPMLVEFLDSVSREYTGTGMPQTTRDKMIADAGTDTLIVWVLSMHSVESEYMMFSGSIIGKDKAIWLDMAVTPTESRLVITDTGSTEVFRYISKKDWDNSDTTIHIGWELFMSAKIALQGKDIESLEATMNMTPMWETGVYQLAYKKNVNTHHIELDQLDPTLLTTSLGILNMDWRIEEERLSFLSGSVIDGMGGIASVTYSLSQSGELKGGIMHPDIPGWVTVSGHYRERDIMIDAIVAGITTSFSHKENDDKSVVGYLRLPVASTSWSGQKSWEFYEEFKMNLSSLFASVSLDMQTVDGWLSGPLIIKAPKSTQEIPQIDIRARKNWKDFGLRLDAQIPELANQKAHFEWDSTIDIHYDKKAKVKIPTESIDSRTIFSGSLIPTPQASIY
jgi:hypothetical protein